MRWTSGTAYISPISALYLPYICPISLGTCQRKAGDAVNFWYSLYLPYISLYLPYICPISALYLPYISPVSALYLPYISTISPGACQRKAGEAVDSSYSVESTCHSTASLQPTWLGLGLRLGLGLWLGLGLGLG